MVRETRVRSDENVLIFCPNKTLGMISSGMGAAGVRMPRRLIKPPVRVEVMDFINVPVGYGQL